MGKRPGDRHPHPVKKVWLIRCLIAGYSPRFWLNMEAGVTG